MFEKCQKLLTGFGSSNQIFPLILAFSVFISSLNFILRRVEHEKSFITLRYVHAGSRQTDEAGQMIMLIRAFTGHTGHLEKLKCLRPIWVCIVFPDL